MKISDITLGRSVLEDLLDKKKGERTGATSRLNERLNARGDSFDAERRVDRDVTRMSELQKNFAKNSVSLRGLQDLRRKLEEQENLASIDRNYDRLSQELSAIIAATKYQGENVISYLSSQVRDEKALYTLKNNLDKEIRNVQQNMSAERKDIASYLVREENLESVRSEAAPETKMEALARQLDVLRADSLHRNIPKIASLLE